MIEPIVVLFDKSYDRAKLEEQLATTETVNGPLIALGHSDDKTAGTFKFDEVPANLVELIEVVDGKITIPVNSAEVCRGFVWVGGAVKQVVAVRDT